MEEEVFSRCFALLLPLPFSETSLFPSLSLFSPDLGVAMQNIRVEFDEEQLVDFLRKNDLRGSVSVNFGSHRGTGSQCAAASPAALQPHGPRSPGPSPGDGSRKFGGDRESDQYRVRSALRPLTVLTRGQ
eukprot:763515-Hanusia_phi.AAC.3